MSGAGDDPEISRLSLRYDEESRVLTWEIVLSDEESESSGCSLLALPIGRYVPQPEQAPDAHANLL